MRVLIVDDEPPARQRLTKILKECAGQSGISLEIAGEAGNGRDAISMALSRKPDVVFLDIEMPVLSGLEAAAVLMETDVLVVFVTAFDQYALKAFESSAVDYLVKPVEKERLGQTLQRLATRLNNKDRTSVSNLVSTMIEQDRLSRIAVRSGNKIEVIPFSEISLVKALDGYAEIYFGDKKILTEDALDSFERRLGPGFSRIHRSAIINLDYLKELVREGDRKYVARLKDYYENEIPVSREALKKLQDRLGW